MAAAAEPQRAVQEQGCRLAGGEASRGDLFGSGAEEADDGGGERAVEVADELAAPDDLLEPGGAGLVGVVAAWRVPVEGRGEQVGVAANELPADVEVLAQSVGGRDGVQAGGVHGGDGFGSRAVEERRDQGVA